MTTSPATLADWQEPPQNRWAFGRVRELVPTARIRAAPTPTPLPAANGLLEGFTFSHEGRDRTIAEALEETYTDGFAVLHDDRLVAEHYPGDLEADRPHLLQSVSKSVVATVAGILAGRGLLDVEAPVTAVLGELAGTAWEGATVQQVLDMRTGTRFDESYDDPRADVRAFEQIYLWRPRTDLDLPTDATVYIAGLPNDGEHGGPFRYRSVLSDLLGWIVERAGGDRLATLIERDLWVPMGAEFDADITVDGHGNAMADGGVSATVRDLLRLGRLWHDDGVVDGRQVLPSAWIADTVAGGHDSSEAFAAGDDGEDAERFPGGHYRNKVWVIDPALPLYAFLGINGQHVIVHPSTGIVVAKVSTWPEPLSPPRLELTLALVRALGEALEG